MNEALTARKLARELLAQAEKNEPQITEDLHVIAEKVAAEMAGLENKFKEAESLTRKISDSVSLNSETVEDAAERINDVLRYTFILESDNYADGFHRTIETLWEIGYFVSEKRIWNAWKNIGTEFDKGYRGINITVISSHKQIFELQFHTVESFRHKNETHNFYEEMRDRNISKEREAELVKIMRAMAVNIKRPRKI